jgi:CHAT domain-containing protein
MLIQRHAIAYLLSATTALQFAELHEQRSSKALALAPGFSDELKQDYIARIGDPSRVDRQFLSYVRQPFAIGTAEKLGDLLSARVMTGSSASEQAFRELARDHGILHLGTHAELNESSPMYSRLVLAKDLPGTGTDGDGYLHAYEIYELDLRAQLAVLTACETGIGKNEAGEGVRSLGYGFAYAGCPSLVTSLWSIDEKVSSEIITRFYGYLADGMPKHLALRQAKLDHLESAIGELTHPYYWAGLVLVGDVEPIERPDDSKRFYLWWVIGALALAGLIWWRRR